MAKYREWANSSNALDLANYIVSLDNRLTLLTSTSPYDIGIYTGNIGSAFIRIDGTTISLFVNNVEIDSYSWGGLGGNYGVESLISDNFILLRIHRPQSAGARWNEIYYIMQDGKYYIGGAHASTDNRKFQLQDISFCLSDASANGFKFPKMINFALPIGKIAYSSFCPLSIQTGYLEAFVDDIISCSEITAGSIISLPDGNNYYTIGTHSMVKLD